MASATPPSHRPPLLRLPLEILFTIADYCSPADVVRLMTCNHELEDKLRCHLLHIDITRNGASAVPWAAFHGRLNLLKDLQAHGASVTGHWGVPLDVYYRRCRGSLQWHVDCSLEYAPDPERNMGMTFSPLHAATVAGHDNVVSWLLDRGAEVDGECKLMCVCHLGRAVQGTRPGFDEVWWTALHLAYCYGHDSTAALLLDRGADRYSMSSTYPGDNALHTAIRAGSLAHVKMLLDPSQRFSIDPNAADNRGVTAVATAVRTDQLVKVACRHRPRDIVTCWFISGSQPRRHQCDTEEEALWPYFPTGLRIKFDLRRCVPSIDPLRLLLEADVALDAESPAKDGFFYHQLILPLHQSLIGGGFAAARLLLEAGAKPDSLSAGHRPLHCVFSSDAAEYGRDDSSDFDLRCETWRESRLHMARKLLAAGADPNATTAAVPGERSEAFWSKNGFTIGVTPLMYAAQRADCVESIKLLLEHGAVADAIDARGQNAIHWVVGALDHENWEYGIRQVYAFQTRRPQQPGAGPVRWKRHAGEIIRLLMQHGCDPKQQNEHNACVFRRVLDIAAAWGRPIIETTLFPLLYDNACHRCLSSTALDEVLGLCVLGQDLDTAEWAISRGGLISEERLIQAWNEMDCFPCDDKLEKLAKTAGVVTWVARRLGVLGVGSQPDGAFAQLNSLLAATSRDFPALTNVVL